MINKHSKINWEYISLLRFFLAFVVLLEHLRSFINPFESIVFIYNLFDNYTGKVAVIGFLLVSGFAIAASLSKGTKGYYQRRFLRIYPLYFFVLFFTSLLQIYAGAVANLNLPLVVNGGEGWPTIIGNLFFLQTFLVKPLAFNGPVWTLGVEVFLYLVAPLLILMRLPYLILLICFSIVCFTLPRHTDWGDLYFVLSHLNLLKYMWAWLLGYMLYVYPSWRTFSFTCLGIIPILVINELKTLSVVIYFASVYTIWLSFNKKMPEYLKLISNYLGDISYPLYLIHFPVLIYLYLYFNVQQFCTMLALIFLITICVYEFVDVYLKDKYLKPIFK